MLFQICGKPISHATRWLALGALVSGCALFGEAKSPLAGSLSGRGPMVLSPENPFIAANLYLSGEMDKSPELKGFVAHRGGPPAIELGGGSFFRPDNLELYYPNEQEAYHLERRDENWIISGPFRLDAGTLADIQRLGSIPFRSPALGSSSARTASPLPAATPPPAETPPEPNGVTPGPFVSEAGPAETPAPEPSPQPPPRAAATPAPRPRPSAPVPGAAEIDAAIAAAPLAEAELSPQGDVVHYVTYPGETLSMIARWYTKDPQNAPRIARINNLKNPNVLSAGDSIVIPAYMLKNKKRLTEEAVAKLATIAAAR